MARRVLHPIFDCPCMHLLSQLTSNFHKRRYYGRQNSRWGDITKRTILERLNYNIAIYLGTYLRASFHRSGVNSLRARSALVLHEQTHIAATRLVWTAMILSSSETSGPVGHLKCTIKWFCWRSTPPPPPLATGLTSLSSPAAPPSLLGGFSRLRDVTRYCALGLVIIRA